MKRMMTLIVVLFLSTLAQAKTFKLPQGKGKCPAFTFEGQDSWTLKSDRPKGDRWKLIDSKTKAGIARFDFDLSNTDQKQLQEVEDKEMQVGAFKLQKYTTTQSFPEEGEKATTGLVTSYSFEEGKLKGLVIMSDEYDAASKLDEKIEKIISSIKIK